MLGNIRNPPEPFGDVIRTHFRLKARSIGAQLDRWLSMDDGKATLSDGATTHRSAAGQSTNGLLADVAELKRMMQQLQGDGSMSTAL